MLIAHLAVGTVVGGTKGRLYGFKDLVDEEVVWFEAAPSGSSDPDGESRRPRFSSSRFFEFRSVAKAPILLI